MDTTYPSGIGIGGYSGRSCVESAIAFLTLKQQETFGQKIMKRKQLPFQLMKLACVISVVLANLMGYPPQAQAQPAEPVSNPSNSTQIQFTQPKFPDHGAPTGRRRGGTGRNECPVLNTSITALVPGEETSGESQSSKSFLASTVAEYPTFWVYVPELPANIRSGEFVLQDEAGNDVYRTPLRLPEKPGILSISLPSNPQYSLENNKKYHWYFRVYCGEPQTKPEYFFVDAWVQRVSLTSDLETQLKTVQPKEYIAYAANTIWYDTITNLAELRRTDSQNAMLEKDWVDLLTAIGLQDLAQEPIVRHFTPE
ncbi:MAG: DUF928 domain-containing protein [Coleofasciculus sp. S288]|nr:DUF928 domain-containing protein [Coleofasciculus sp. S288]